jgi:uncharacterized 2Fe-2S/4Fe-4S cluster protein (DUF4445 family)
MNKRITVTVNGKPMLAVGGTVLSEIINGEKPCGGHGKCGKCKVIAVGTLSPLSDAERAHLSEDEISRGVRLACVTTVLGDCRVQTEFGKKDAKKQIVTDGDLPSFDLNPVFSKYGVAVDIGTTTLAARLYDQRGEVLSETSRLNPQSNWGADVISRIEADLRGEGEALASSIRQALNEVFLTLAEDAGISAVEIDGAVITGNTVMLYLLTATSTEPLSHAPFAMNRSFGETLTAKELELNSLTADTPIYLPPCISAFVGADITCAILSSQLTKNDAPMLLVDIGTNGEIALWQNGKLSVCSTAAGPAFEGVGIAMGMNAAAGAIDRVSLDGDALVTHTIGEVAPKGICGSGLIDAVACLLENEILDPSGYLEDDPAELQAPVTLTQKDIRMVQLAKSAICAGILTLMKVADVPVEQLSALLVAGGFGRYLNMENAGKIGLLPPALIPVTKTIGNAALSGAILMLLDQTSRATAVKLAERATTVDLATNPIFMGEYTNGMLFDYI